MDPQDNPFTPATWTALTTLAGPGPAEGLGAAMEEMDPAPVGIGVFEMEDGSGLWEVGAYFTQAPSDIDLALLAAAFGAKPFAVSELPETDWVAHVRRDLHPVAAGRFFVYGSHDADKVPEGAVPLLVEAAMAFGTGHHGTTQGCLEAFDALLADGLAPGPVADVGAGTAVLAMAAARVWGGDVPIVASDIDAVAVEVAAANVAANGLGGTVECVEAAGFGHPVLGRHAPYALIFANILKGPLIDLAPDMAAHCAPGGHAILSGLLDRQADEVRTAYEAAGFAEAARRSLEGWTTLTLRR
ncbi:50S ribosomal protein L11 methyltransferase [Jannaschia sp. Os4]|uniref:50S ribosomal protein L11 methyltransferase n=1 Tax=Jannaschia sp. Os4 TaxID=2807617 RepID=UPI00193A3C7C|nr:50S ribosomal protein L11 methyltransferase [Jannaschia sp. Os4]MBM2574722.1 50S ribosomal protein L11 methyltransferase [Jannaschia sp. Os4]